MKLITLFLFLPKAKAGKSVKNSRYFVEKNLRLPKTLKNRKSLKQPLNIHKQRKKENAQYNSHAHHLCFHEKIITWLFTGKKFVN